MAFGLQTQLPARAEAAAVFPPPPTYYVLDQPRVLSSKMSRALETVLVEHDRLTGQQIMLAIFDSIPGSAPSRNAGHSNGLEAMTQEIFDEWKVGQRGEDNGALLAIYWKERVAALKTGTGLASLLTDARIDEIVDQYLLPEIAAANPDRAAALAIFQIMMSAQSPLIDSGRADQIFRAGGFRGDWNEVTSIHRSYGWIMALFLGVCLMIGAANLVTAADAHFTAEGWFRPRPWQWPASGTRGAFAGGGASAEW